MPFKVKHTGNFFAAFKFFNKLKDLRSLFLATAFLFILSQGFAANQDVQKVYTTENATIVYSANDNNKVVVTEGKITAIEGKTIRLLPGTHIKSSAQLIVNIASKECQDAVAAEIAIEKEKTLLAFTAERRKEVLLPYLTEVIPTMFSNGQLPLPNTTLGQQSMQLTAMLVNGSVSINAPVSLINKKILLSDIYHIKVSSDLWLYTPIYSWGERAENIMVLLC